MTRKASTGSVEKEDGQCNIRPPMNSSEERLLLRETSLKAHELIFPVPCTPPPYKHLTHLFIYFVYQIVNINLLSNPRKKRCKTTTNSNLTDFCGLPL